MSVDLWLGFDPGKGKTKLAKVIGERFGGFGHGFCVVRLANTDLDQGLELFVLVEVVALELDARDHKTLPFGHVDGDRHFLLVWRHRHLGRVNPELQKTTGQVVRPQSFQVGVEFGAGIAVRLGVPAHPATGIQVELVT